MFSARSVSILAHQAAQPTVILTRQKDIGGTTNRGRDGLVGLVLKEMLGKTYWIRER